MCRRRSEGDVGLQQMILCVYLTGLRFAWPWILFKVPNEELVQFPKIGFVIYTWIPAKGDEKTLTSHKTWIEHKGECSLNHKSLVE